LVLLIGPDKKEEGEKSAFANFFKEGKKIAFLSRQ